MTTDPTARHIATLARRYEWALTAGQTARLRDALADLDHDSMVAAARHAERHAAGRGRAVTFDDIAQALEVRQRNRSEPDRPATVTRISEHHQAAARAGLAATRAALDPRPPDPPEAA